MSTRLLWLGLLLLLVLLASCGYGCIGAAGEILANEEPIPSSDRAIQIGFGALILSIGFLLMGMIAKIFRRQNQD